MELTGLAWATFLSLIVGLFAWFYALSGGDDSPWLK